MSIKIKNTDNFDTLRQAGGYYVDKTGFLDKFLESPEDASLFTRPRRFGKTLFMSMLASFLTGALRITKESIFTGLNNLDCFDIANPKYADVFGFTQGQLPSVLRPRLDVTVKPG